VKRLALVLSIALALAASALAQEPKRKTLAFGDAPADWKPRPKERKPFLCDYSVPLAEGDAEDSTRVNVLLYTASFDDYRKKILEHWKRADGTPFTLEDQKTGDLQKGDLELRTIEESGTHTQKGGPDQQGWTLLAVHIQGPGGRWTAWLLGPRQSVEKNRAAYLAWARTAHEVDSSEAESEAVREVRFVHGAPEHGVPGPWALAAYRIGKNALSKFGLTREKAWELVVTHKAPKEVRYSCMLDGLLASTGCSPGKMNLVHDPVENEDALETVVLHKPTGRTLTYKLTKAFRDKIRDVEPAGFPVMAKLLEGIKDDEVFTVEEGKAEKK
jgi:hypothetical protein